VLGVAYDRAAAERTSVLRRDGEIWKPSRISASGFTMLMSIVPEVVALVSREFGPMLPPLKKRLPGTRRTSP
jgi:hypothetical protein